MRPIAIFRHVRHEGPGALADFLGARGVPWRLIAIDAGDPIPGNMTDFSGLVFMGGPMSVNDDLPWIGKSLDLIRQAVAADIPLLGHCLGGQLLAKAMGGSVGRNPVREIGWGRVYVADHPVASDWFGDTREFMAFHWHGETFSIPPGATRVLGSEHCPNQAFVVGKHLALQCHVEMTEPMVREWCAVGAEEITAARGPTVDSAEAIVAATAACLPAMNAVAEHLYGRWLQGVRDSVAARIEAG